MLPRNLIGPGTSVLHEEGPAFVSCNSIRYPHLDPDFISQICYEHPDRFNHLYPGFDVSVHAAIRRRVSAAWVADNVAYEGEECLAKMWEEGWKEEGDCRDNAAVGEDRFLGVERRGAVRIIRAYSG